MTAPTKPKSAADLLEGAYAGVIAAAIVMADAIVAAQNEGLSCEPTLRTIHRELLTLADRQDAAIQSLAAKPPRFELIPGGIASSGVCPECGRIGDHQPRCPEVSE